MHFTIDGQLPVVACIISWILGIITLPLCLNIFKVLVKVLFRLKPTKVHNKKKLLQHEDLGEEDAYKLVLCVRNDLAMGKGKIAAQCSHAAIGTYIDGIKNNCGYLNEWLNNGQRKVVVKIKDYEEMKLLYKEAKRRNINTHITCDAGKTQVPSGSYTVIAIGPAPDEILNNITGHLKLLRLDKVFSELARKSKEESFLPTYGYRSLFKNPGNVYKVYMKCIVPWFYRCFVGPSERWIHASLTKYLREHCLLFDDLLSEHDVVIERALTMLAPDLAMARFRRIARSIHISMLRIYPTLEEQNYDPFIPYLAPYVEEAKFQLQEEEELLGYHPTDRRLFCGGTTGLGEFEPGMHFFVSIPNVYGAAMGHIHKK